MKMRTFRLGERYFHPWDHLQLSEDLDGSHRVDKVGTFYRMFYTKRRKFAWSAGFHDNMLFFTEEDDENNNMFELLRVMVEQTDQSSEIALYDFDGSMKTQGLKMDDENEYFFYHPYPLGFENFLDDVLKHCRKILRKSKGREPANKLLQFIIIRLTDEMLGYLVNTPDVAEKFFKVLKQNFARVYPVVFYHTARLFPKEWLPKFDHVYFLGTENWKYAADVLHPDWQITSNSATQKLSGIAMAREYKDIFLSISPRDYTYSEWGKQYYATRTAENNLYRQFLASLNDGEKDD